MTKMFNTIYLIIVYQHPALISYIFHQSPNIFLELQLSYMTSLLTPGLPRLQGGL